MTYSGGGDYYGDDPNQSDYERDEMIRRLQANGGVAPTENRGQPQSDFAPTAPTTPPPQLSSFDPRQQVGHDGKTSNGWNREQYRDAWQGSGVNSVDGAKAWLAQNGGEWLSDNGQVRTPFGEILDMGENARGSAAGNGVFKTAWGGTAGDGGGSGGGGGAAVGAPAPTALPAATGTAGLVSPEDEASKNAIRELLMKMAMQGTAVDRNDPNLQQQVEPFAAQQERFRRQYESEGAERLSAQGLGSSGAMEQERRLGMERAGQNTGLFESQLVAQELQTRRDEIKFALENLRGMLSTEQSLGLQQQLAQLDAALKRESLAQQGSQFDRSLSQRDHEFGIDSGIRIGEVEARYAPWR